MLTVVVLVTLFQDLAPSPHELLAQAEEVYASALETEDRDLRLERFHRAELLYEQILERGFENASIYVNIGNSALQAERLGPAILAYRRALRLDPDHHQARENLEHARGLLPSWVPRPESASLFDTFFFWHSTLSPGERGLYAAISFCIALVLLSIAIRWRRAWARNLAIVPALFWIALVASMIADRVTETEARDAVITSPDVIARAANSRQAPRRFPEDLPGGTEIQILEEQPHWTHIRLANGRDAWVRADSVTPVGRDS